MAYAEGLNTEFDMLETMERELFIDTAENSGITERERFVGKINADYPLEKRREMLKISEQKVGGKCTPDDFKRNEQRLRCENFTHKLPQETVWILKFRIQKQTQRRSS